MAAEHQSAHLILLGSPRSNGLLHDAQSTTRLNFEVEDLLIKNARIEDPLENEEYKDHLDGQVLVAYGVLSRRRDWDKQCITSLAANHSRLVEKMGSYLTTDSSVQSMLESRGVCGREDLPDKFEIVFRTRILQFEQVAGSLEIMASRGFPQNPAKDDKSDD